MQLLDRFLNAMKWRPQQTRTHISHRQAGVVVNEDTALAYSAVHACVRIISETMAALPWQVYRKASQGRESMSGHPVQWLLGTQANPEMSAFIFRRTMLAHQLVWGNAYAEIERGNDGRAIWLWPLPPDRCRLARSETGSVVLSVSTEQSGPIILPRENVFCLSDGGFDGITGMSRIQLARRAIGVGIAADAFAASYYANGAAIGGIIEDTKGKMTPEAREILLDSFNKTYAGPDRSHKTLYLDAGMTYKPIALPLADAQFLETRRYQIEEIARWYGVPLHLLNDLTNANYAISYEASKNFVEHTLRPLCVLAEQEANIRLFGTRVQGQIYSRMNLNGLMRADPKTRGEYYRSLINSGVMSINEVRELEELNHIGPDGDQHYLQLNMTTISRIANPPDVVEAPQVVAEPKQIDEPVPQPANVIRREALEWWDKQKLTS